MSRDSERRAAQRVEFDEPAVVYLNDRRVRGRAIDISRGGMGLHLPESISIGSFVRVNFALTDPRGVERWHDADAIVARCRPADGVVLVGLRFAAIPPLILTSIEQYVQEHRKADAIRRQARLYAARFEQGRTQPAVAPAPARQPEPAPRARLRGLVRERSPSPAANASSASSAEQELQDLYRRAVAQIDKDTAKQR